MTGTWPQLAASLLLPLVPLSAIFGNTLVMIAVYRERSLQTVTNLLIVSLAVSDLLVALFVMSFGIYFQMNDFEWGLGRILCNVYLASDVMCSTASILNLLAISLDRFMAISHPIMYAQHGTRGSRAMVSISTVWGLSIAVGLPILFGVNPPENETSCEFANPYFNIGSSLLSFFIPCLAMIILYAVIFKRLRERERARSQRKATKMENERISSALLGGARFASQMGRHFKNKADQILLEISFQTSSFPTLSESSEEHTSSSANGCIRLTPPVQLPPLTSAPVPSPVSSPVVVTEVFQKKDSNGTHRAVDSMADVVVVNTKKDIYEDNISSTINDCVDVYRSFGEHLQELFPFIDSISRRSSILDDNDDQLSEAFTVPETNHKRRHSSKRHRKGNSAVDNEQRTLVQSARSTPLRRTLSATRHNGSLPHRNGTVSLQNCTLDEAKAPAKREPAKHCFSQPGVGLEVPKVHRTVATSHSDGKALCNNMNSNLNYDHLREFQRQQQEMECSIGDSVKMYRKELWKRVTSGWKSRPSRQLVKKATKQMRREHKATVTLAVVLAVFLAFWLPFFIMHFTNSVCILMGVEGGCVNPIAISISTWLGYINSSLNPLIYTVFDQRFRNAFKHIVCCSTRRR